jgi:hypothetical protein
VARRGGRLAEQQGRPDAFQDCTERIDHSWRVLFAANWPWKPGRREKRPAGPACWRNFGSTAALGFFQLFALLTLQPVNQVRQVWLAPVGRLSGVRLPCGRSGPTYRAGGGCLAHRTQEFCVWTDQAGSR